MEVYLKAYCRFKQEDKVQSLAITEFLYNNSWQASIIMSFFDALLGYYLQMSYKDN